ncbi:head-tail connector protein [Bordetella bronchiseptica]|uniref:head-tail connector protein n=1 Tax=Bordetella bronchiseptica TaxID=518 RepID=UPI000528069E|nr:head-tail connector protein [Bordetella bronchiseptica]
MLRLIKSPTKEPVDLEFVKGLLRIDHDAFDLVLPSLVAAAREVVERQTGFGLADAEYQWTPVGARTAPLPIRPATVISVDGARPIVLRVEPSLIPESLKLAIAMLVGGLLANPESSVEKIVAENPALKAILFMHTEVLP